MDSIKAIVISLSQAADAVSASRGALLDLFERIENVFRRLEVYIEVPPTAGMTDSVVKVMVEVLQILAIVTKEIKQSRISESIPGDGSTPSRVDLSFLRNFWEETGWKNRH